MKKMNFIKRYCMLLLVLAIEVTSLSGMSVLTAQASALSDVEHVYITSDSGAVVGSTLTVNYTLLNGASEDGCTYQWWSCNRDEIKANDQDGAKKLDGAENKTYTLTDAEVNKYIFCVVTPASGNADVSLSYGKIKAKGTDSPSVDNTSMRIWANDLSVGSTLYAHYTYQNPDGTAESGTTIQWQRADSFRGTYTDIEGATEDTYVIKQEDYGKCITFKVTLANGAAAEMNNRVYCSPGNLIPYADVVGSSMRNPLTSKKIHAASDFIVDNIGDMTWSVQNPVYTIDAGETIEWNKIVLLGESTQRLIKLEVSDDKSSWTNINADTVSYTSNTLVEYTLDNAVSGRYIRATLEQDPLSYGSDNNPSYTNSFLKEVQVYMVESSVSELKGISLEGAVFHGDVQSIEGIAAETTVAQLKAAVTNPSEAVLTVLKKDGTEAQDTDTIVSGAILRSVSKDGKTTTDYRLYNETNAVIISDLKINTSSEKGVHIGSLLRADYTLESTGSVEAKDTNLRFNWYMAETPDAPDGEWTSLSKGFNAQWPKYEVVGNVNSYIRVEAKYTNTGAVVRSEVVGPINAKSEAPAVEQVYLTSDRNAVVGATLTVNYTPINGASENECTYRWYASGSDEITQTGTWRDYYSNTPVLGTGRSYTVTEANAGKYIFCVVTPYGGKPAISMSYGKIVAKGSKNQQVDSNSLRIWANDVRIGSTLHAYYTYQNPLGGIEPNNVQVQWQRADSFGGEYIDIEGATEKTYVLKPEDFGKFITFTATVNGKTVNMNNRVYCSPENGLAYAYATCDSTNISSLGWSTTNEAIAGATDFIINNTANYTWGENDKNVTYIFDARRDIQWDKVVFLDEFMNKITKIEVSDDGKTWTDMNIDEISFTSNERTEAYITENNERKIISGRYMRVTFAQDTKYASFLKEFQVYLSSESFSELLGVDLDGASYDRDGKAITNIPAATTVSRLKESLKKANTESQIRILNTQGLTADDSDTVKTGYSLISTSQNGKTETMYRLSNTAELSGIAVDKENKTAYISADKAYSNAAVIIASYKEEELLSISLGEGLKKGENKIVIPDEVLSNGADSHKIMVWNSFNNLTPLFNAADF